MKTADTHTLEIKSYNDWLILKLIPTPKIKYIGIGTMLSDFNKFDVLISDEALKILKNNLNKDLDKTDPALEILSEEKIWWASTSGILIKPNELIHIYTIPYHTYVNNDVDEELKKIIKQNN